MAKKKLDVKNHILVPNHKRLSEKEKKELFEIFGISINELPKVFITDMGISHLDISEDDVIQVPRKSPVSGESIFYRRVVDV